MENKYDCFMCPLRPYDRTDGQIKLITIDMIPLACIAIIRYFKQRRAMKLGIITSAVK